MKATLAFSLVFFISRIGFAQANQKEWFALMGDYYVRCMEAFLKLSGIQ